MSAYHDLQDVDDTNPKLQFLMFPWLGYGHITPYLHLSNELAKRGHKITFLSPANDKAKHRLQAMNHHPNLITFIPLSLPHVPGLPPAAETTSDISIEQATLLGTAFDLTRPKVEEIISQLQPNFVLYDFAYWIPDITSKLIGIKSVCYHVIPATILSLNFNRKPGEVTPPQGYPSSKVWPRGKHEMRGLMFALQEFGGKGLTLHHRLTSATKNSDVVALRTCREVEGKFCDYLSLHLDHRRPVLLTGPVLPPPDLDNNTTILDERWARWLGQFKDGEVVYCAFGSQSCFDRKQLEEILLGLEMTGLPFFAALAPRNGCEKIEDVLPEGFTERVQGRGVVYGGWVQQPALLSHPSVGCFVNHCGFGTMWEGIMSDCQLVQVPQLLDQILSTRNITEEMGMAVEVQREEDNGWISKESLCKAVKIAMDEGSQVGDTVRKNHAKWRQRLAAQGFMAGYVDDFVKSLEGLLQGN